MLFIRLLTYITSLFLALDRSRSIAALSTRRSFAIRREGTIKRGSLMVLRAMGSERESDTTQHPSDVNSWNEIASLATLAEVRTLLTLVVEENVEAVRFATISIDDGEEIARKNRKSLFGSGEVSEQMIHCFHKLDLWLTNLALDYVRTEYIRDNNKSPHITYLNEMVENIDSSQTLARLLQQSPNLRTSEAASLRYQRNNADHHTPGSPRHLVERLMSEGLKDHRDRDGGYQSNRNQNNGESSRANVMGDRSSDHTITNPSPNVKKAGKKYGLSRPQGDTWAKRIADNIEADKTAAKNMGEKSSASSSSSSSSAAAINSKNIDLLAIAQDVIDARALLSKNFEDKISSFLTSTAEADNLDASILDTKTLLEDISISGGEGFVINDNNNDSNTENEEGRIALKDFHRSTVCLTLASPFAQLKRGIPSASTIDRAIADSMNRRPVPGQQPQNIEGLNTNAASGVLNNGARTSGARNNGGLNNGSSPSFNANYLNDDGSISPQRLTSDNDNDLSDNNTDNNNDSKNMSTEFSSEPDESDGVQVNAGAGYSETEFDGVDGEEGLGKIVNDLLGSIFGGFGGASGEGVGGRKGWRQEDGSQTKPDPDGVRVGLMDPPNNIPPRRPPKDDHRHDDNDDEKRNPVDYGDDIPEGNIADFFKLEGVRIRVVSHKVMSQKNTLKKEDFGQKYLLLEGKSQPQLGPNGVLQVQVMRQWIKYEDAIAFLKSGVDETLSSPASTTADSSINSSSATDTTASSSLSSEQSSPTSTASDRQDKSPFLGGDVPMM